MDPRDDMSLSSSKHSLSSEESPSLVSSSDPSSSQNVHKTEAPKVSLSQDETRAVNRSKLLVYVSLVLCAIAIGTSTFYIAHQGEVQRLDAAVRRGQYLLVSSARDSRNLSNVSHLQLRLYRSSTAMPKICPSEQTRMLRRSLA